jgi:hypothetical protein
MQVTKLSQVWSWISLESVPASRECLVEQASDSPGATDTFIFGKSMKAIDERLWHADADSGRFTGRRATAPRRTDGYLFGHIFRITENARFRNPLALLWRERMR